jgi:hypothetical protein
MPDQSLIPRPDLLLKPADPADLVSALSYALRYDERGKPNRNAVEIMAAITGEHLAERLEAAGFVVMRRPPTRKHSAG